MVWPGDSPFESHTVCRIGDGDSVNLSTIKTSVHNGTHVDAPWHYDEQGTGIDELALNPFLGPCTVIDVMQARPITPQVFVGADIRPGDRVLLRTADRLPTVWEDDNAHLSTETVIELSNFECPLVGIDSSSVDPSRSLSLEAHKALGRYQIHILENLDLTLVAPGRYVLVALPLKLRGLDASPVRAVLFTEDEWQSVGRSQSSSRI